MNNVTVLSDVFDDISLVAFITDKKKHYLYKHYKNYEYSSILQHTLDILCPIIDTYEKKVHDTTEPFVVDEPCAREIWTELVKNHYEDISFNQFKKPQRTYKIKHKITGQYSTGGDGSNSKKNTSGWSKKGKVWSCISHLKSHLSQNTREDYVDCEVVVFKEEKRFDIQDIEKHRDQ